MRYNSKSDSVSRLNGAHGRNNQVVVAFNWPSIELERKSCVQGTGRMKYIKGSKEKTKPKNTRPSPNNLRRATETDAYPSKHSRVFVTLLIFSLYRLSQHWLAHYFPKAGMIFIVTFYNR